MTKMHIAKAKINEWVKWHPARTGSAQKMKWLAKWKVKYVGCEQRFVGLISHGIQFSRHIN